MHAERHHEYIWRRYLKEMVGSTFYNAVAYFIIIARPRDTL